MMTSVVAGTMNIILELSDNRMLWGSWSWESLWGDLLTLISLDFILVVFGIR
jgi:hypothetical protein